MKTQKKYNIKRVVLILSGVIIASAGIFAVVSEFMNSEKISIETPVADYRSDMNVSYNVIPKANMLYGEGILNEGLTYITEFVNQVDSNFEYKVSGDSTMKVNGYYSVNVVFTGYVDSEGEGANVWSKQKEIVPKTEFNLNATGDVLKQRVRMDVDDYNSFVKTVIEASSIKVPVKATVTMAGEATIKNSNGETIEPISGSLVIPLDKSYFNIEKTGVGSKEGNIFKVEEIQAPLNLLKISVSAILLMAGIIILAYGSMSKPLDNEGIRFKDIKKMLSSYGSRSAAVGKISTEKMDSIYEIKLMEDIVKVADELGKPILYEYRDNIKDIEYFCVIDGSTMYRYNIEVDEGESVNASLRYARIEI
ncbi:DUF5305 family protein [Proteocatella sphenisci]|uniref:DUF5305 family protein n=1 Tax=Proteocatella sphenisci TaxID=181070 RepID=UPI00049148DD|nr:DUF5305 family protein [Proteocatella sphenisci]